jgi:acyl-CoA synthetase (AMP-forming)/AMP-acid ligase II
MYLTQGLHRAVQQVPDAPATMFGERVRTWRQHADRVARLAGALRGLGVADGSRVGILARNSDRYAELLLAVPWAGGVFTPVNIRWNRAGLIYALRDSATTILCADDAAAGLVPALAGGHPDLTTLICLGDGPPPEGMYSDEDLVDGALPVEDARRGGGALTGIFCTSGITGVPKVGDGQPRQPAHHGLGQQATVPAAHRGGRALLVLPMFHIGAFTAWLPQLAAGGTQVIVPAFEPVTVLETIARHRVTTVLLVPAMLQVVVDHPAWPGFDLSSVATFLYGASPASEAMLERAMRVFPRAAFTQLYGMTEAAGTTAMLGPDEHRAGKNLRAAGRAAAHAEVRIADIRDRELPRGAVGEVACRGGHVMSGYWNRPQETAGALRGGWLHTGDAGYMDDDGYVYLVDRVKDMIVSGGENVYSAEVEKRDRLHPAVASRAVIRRPRSGLGRAGPRRHRAPAGPYGWSRRDPRALQDPDRRLQGAAELRIRRPPALVRGWQGPQTRPAQAVPGQHWPRRPLRPPAMAWSRSCLRRSPPDDVRPSRSPVTVLPVRRYAMIGAWEI